MRRSSFRRAFTVIAILGVLASGVAACSTDDPGGSEHSTHQGAHAGFPVTVRSCGEDVTFTHPPERAVVNDNNMVELMFALGLADRMAGYAGVGDNRMNQPRFAADYRSVPSLGDDYFTLEPLMGADPDFVFAGWNYGFSQETGITPEVLAENDIPSYVLTESCRRVVDGMGPSSIQDWYSDIRAIGMIFGVSDRAEQLIAESESQVAAVQTCLPAESERTAGVFTFLSGDDVPGTAPGLTIVPALDALSGGRNVFADVATMWGKVTWEEVVARAPDLIVVVDYGTGPTGEEKVAQLRRNPAIAGVPAVKNNRFLILPQNAVNPGTRIAEGVEKRAAALYPQSCRA